MTNLVEAISSGRYEELRNLRALFVHAHPDDETLQSGSLIAWLNKNNAIVDLLTCTRGEKGEVVDGVLPATITQDDLVRARMAELKDACSVLGIRRGYFLGKSPARAEGLVARHYSDSGMRWADEAQTQAIAAEDITEDAFTLASIAEASADLAALIKVIEPTALFSYEASGTYGHPDHIAAYQVTKAVAEQLGIARYEITPRLNVDGFYYPDLSECRESLVEALNCYQTQVIVHNEYLTHVGGQQAPLPTTIGIRLAN